MGWSADASGVLARMGFTRGRFLTQPSFDRHGLMRRDGWMQSEHFPTTYVGYVLAL